MMKNELIPGGRRRYASDTVVNREVERAIEKFGGVESYELFPDGRLIVVPANAAGAAEPRDELAEYRARRDARRS